jgi:hypothetical protein
VLLVVMLLALYRSSRIFVGDAAYLFPLAVVEARELSCCPGMYGAIRPAGHLFLLTTGQAIAMPGMVSGEHVCYVAESQ